MFCLDRGFSSQEDQLETPGLVHVVQSRPGTETARQGRLSHSLGRRAGMGSWVSPGRHSPPHPAVLPLLVPEAGVALCVQMRKLRVPQETLSRS